MHKGDGAGHVNGTFVSEDAATGRAPTEITAEWLNALQEELIAVISDGGITPTKGVNDQLKAALAAKFLPRPAGNVVTDSLLASGTLPAVLTTGQVTDTTDASSLLNGALRVAGGGSIVKKLFVGGGIDLSGGSGQIKFPVVQTASADPHTLDDCTRGVWTPSFTNLTVVNGTGGATFSGRYVKLGRLCFWEAYITVTGTCTTACIGGTTYINNTPFVSSYTNSGCTACDATPNSFGVGQCQGIYAWPPSWSARNSGIFISGTLITN